MKINQKGFRLVKVLLILAIAGIVALVGFYLYSLISSNTGNTPSLKSGADIEIITGGGGMPPESSPGVLLEGEEFTVVFTEPFSSLESWQESNEVKQITTTSGKVSVDLAAGKYGIYYIYKGQKILYTNLTLENPKKDIQRDKQGPWYLEVNNFQRNKLKFSVNSLAV